MTKTNVVIKRRRVQVFCGDGLTKQAFRDESNINNIMAKYKTTGLIDHVSKHAGNYGDYTDVVDYQTAMNTVIAAQDMFMSIPSNIRARFGNDPGQFLEFVSNPDNREEMAKLGLLKVEVSPPDLVPLEALKSNENAPD